MIKSASKGNAEAIATVINEVNEEQVGQMIRRAKNAYALMTAVINDGENLVAKYGREYYNLTLAELRCEHSIITRCIAMFVDQPVSLVAQQIADSCAEAGIF